MRLSLSTSSYLDGQLALKRCVHTNCNGSMQSTCPLLTDLERVKVHHEAQGRADLVLAAVLETDGCCLPRHSRHWRRHPARGRQRAHPRIPATASIKIALHGKNSVRGDIILCNKSGLFKLCHDFAQLLDLKQFHIFAQSYFIGQLRIALNWALTWLSTEKISHSGQLEGPSAIGYLAVRNA